MRSTFGVDYRHRIGVQEHVSYSTISTHTLSYIFLPIWPTLWPILCLNCWPIIWPKLWP
nr:MAG TPA: hypothetical protein [Caudoviricetes sp.]